MNKDIDHIPAETLNALVRYPWPGNIRELQNFIERAVILSPCSVLCAPIDELEHFNARPETGLVLSRLAEVERQHILRALQASNWVVGGRRGAAECLGMKRTSLIYRHAQAWNSPPGAARGASCKERRLNLPARVIGASGI